MSKAYRKHGGYALVEMVLAIGAVAIVLGLCGGILHVLLRLERTARSHLTETATIGRLARQFRQDVHASREANSSGGENGPAPKLELTLPGDRAIAYEMRPRALVRRERQGASTLRYETYVLPLCREGDFVVQAQGAKVWVRLRLRRGPENEAATGANSPRQELAIVALGGRDLAPREAGPLEREVTP
jgi:hypothetical protein